MATANSHQLPGVSVKKTQVARRFLNQEAHIMTKGIIIPSDVVDAGGTPTTKLRPGLVLVKVIAAGANQNKFVQVGHANAPAFAGGNITPGRAVILDDFVNMLDDDAVATERGAKGLVHGWVEDGQIVYGTATGSEITELRDAMPLVLFEADNL